MEEFYHQQQRQQKNWNSRTDDFNSCFTNCDDSFSCPPDPFDSDPTSVSVVTLQIGTGKVPSSGVNADGGAIIELIGWFDGDSNGSFHATLLNSQHDPIRDPSLESSSISEKVPKRNVSKNPRKRTSNAKGKKEIGSLIHEDDGNGVKRTKSDESSRTEKSGGSKNGKANGITKDDTKDYIHVRARRGQATDSHSLAERVRREKISQRMKFLQDLVPGCNKVTGKVVMLDEIINYVQSLQRQVEFLSMKLSTLNPSTDINMEALLSKDFHQARSLLSQSIFALESSSASASFPFRYQSHCPLTMNVHSDRSDASFSMSQLNTERRNHGVHLSSMDGFDKSASQVSMRIDELHNVVAMGYGKNEQQNYQGSLTASDWKMEPQLSPL